MEGMIPFIKCVNDMLECLLALTIKVNNSVCLTHIFRSFASSLMLEIRNTYITL